MDISTLMLQVLDDPTDVRIIVNTIYPDFSDRNGIQNAYFMIDRSNGGGVQKIDENGKGMVQENGLPVWEDPEIYDYWQVTDSLGQEWRFSSNIELIDFLDSIEKITTGAYVESF